MRVVLDIQGAQSASRLRGIGRYSLALAQAIVRNAGPHEIFLALNGVLPESVETIRAAFLNLLPRDHVRVWYAPGPFFDLDPDNGDRRRRAEYLREAFLASLNPDIVHVSSIFEGFGDSVATSIGTFASSFPTAASFYDLIPFLNPEHYLEANSVHEGHYFRKIQCLKRADLLLAISESSRQEALSALGFDSEKVINIGSATDEYFKPVCMDPVSEKVLRERYGLDRPFVMCTSGIDLRKNNENLIRAFARLPRALLEGRQLVIICAVESEDRLRLLRLARSEGLAPSALVMPGYVPDRDLRELYSLCELFVFPSWHEGFGLPALEAMACGAAVIGSNTSSLPEVIGRTDALFDPHDVGAIANKITELLSNDILRADLRHHGLQQAQRFSWDITGAKAIAAFEELHAMRKQAVVGYRRPPRRPRLAYVSPLPPERSGIADYSAELLPELARHYDIEIVSPQANIENAWIRSSFPLRSPEWFRNHAGRYERILYHFGNSSFHSHMFDLLGELPGVVVLHDFFLSGVQAHDEIRGHRPIAWSRELQYAHGYAAVQERVHASDAAEIIWKYPANLSVLQHAEGVLVHSEFSSALATQWYGRDFAKDWSVIPLLRVPVKADDGSGVAKAAARQHLGVPEGAFMACSFGMVGPTKLNHRLLKAWLASPLANDPRCYLVFVGENHGGDYGRDLLSTIQKLGLGNRVRITGWADADLYRRYLQGADVAVQLRSLSRGETSGAVLDCMNHGLATIVNANGSLAEIPDDAVRVLPDLFMDQELIDALGAYGGNPECRGDMGRRAQNYIHTHHAPRLCADLYAESVERFYAKAQTGTRALLNQLADQGEIPAQERAALAQAIAWNLPLRSPFRTLFVDVSELVRGDARTGIHRVTRSILRELLANPPPGWRVEPVYASTARESGYRYARQFAMRFLDCPEHVFRDDPVEAYPGDIFLGLDLESSIVSAQEAVLDHMHQRGVQIYFIVYDLLPVLLPDCFPPESALGHARWLQTISRYDGVICISRAVADEMRTWLCAHGPQRLLPFKIAWCQLGADIESSVSTRGVSNDALSVFAALKGAPTFLMVGTVEPRKGHRQTLLAFEQLWDMGVAVNLVVVGRGGWMVEDLIECLGSHAQLGKHLFWLQGISDEYLEEVYAASTCLIAASEGEGFGLPLIEAARHQLPIIARDIPVFREVAGCSAYYFSGLGPPDLAEAVVDWMQLWRAGRHPDSGGMPWLTWKESAARLQEILLKGDWVYSIAPDGQVSAGKEESDAASDPILIERGFGQSIKVGFSGV